jgi:hypothetical protein
MIRGEWESDNESVEQETKGRRYSQRTKTKEQMFVPVVGGFLKIGHGHAKGLYRRAAQ